MKINTILEGDKRSCSVNENKHRNKGQVRESQENSKLD
jgi:hypothetical protein